MASETQGRTHAQPVSPLSTPSATRAVLERHGLYTKHALGQNFLVSDDVLRKILELADVAPGDSILEVGPGIGTLSAALLGRGAHVLAIEKDASLPSVLADTLAPWSDRFALLGMDALDVRECDLEHAAFPTAADDEDDPASTSRTRNAGGFPLPSKMVANLPYAVAATVVLDYLQRFDSLQSATVMVQKEVADRMMAKPKTKEYGAYTVKLALYAQPAGRFSVAAGNFFPPPRVESSVVRLDRVHACADDGHVLSPAELSATCEAIDAAFFTRRKTIANSCKAYFSGRAEIANLAEYLQAAFERAGIDPRRRGETLTRAEFIRLGAALSE